jgi:hypothetical protein
LLQNGRERIVYGVPLVRNLLEYSLGIDSSPAYLFDIDQLDADRALADWWYRRWGKMRAANSAVLDAIRAHTTLVRPVRHGARVVLPSEKEL